MVSQLDELRDCAVAGLCNPNNPNGRQVEPGALRELAGRLAEQRGWLVVDEAFADVVPGASLAPHVDQAGCVVLRSFGKFFGLAGLRLGFALANPSLAGAIRRALGPWAVSGPACRIATEALGDGAWITETRTCCFRRAASEASSRSMVWSRKAWKSFGVSIEARRPALSRSATPSSRELGLVKIRTFL